MMKLRKSMLAVGILALAAIPVVAAGLWPTLPTVGGASRCASTTTSGVPGTTPVCTVTVPAGPTGVTGNELVPADTQLSSNRAPQTVYMPVPLLASGATEVVTPLTGGVVTIPNGVNNYLINPAGTIATLSVTMPAAPHDGQLLRIVSSKTVTALTLSANSGQTISNTPTAITLSTTGSYGYAFMYHSTVWYRLQ